MSGRFVVIDRPVSREDGAFFASHTPRLLAFWTERLIRGFVGVGQQRLGREAGRNRHRHGVGRSFDLQKGHGLRSSERMVLLLAENDQHLVGDPFEFFRRRFCEWHGQSGGSG